MVTLIYRTLELTLGYDTAIRRTLLTATDSNIAFKIAAKSLKVETWLLLKAYRKSLPPYPTTLSPTSTTYRLATIWLTDRETTYCTQGSA